MSSRTIGLDYDHKNVSYVRGVLHVIYSNYNPNWLILSKSPSNRGYHVKFSTDIELSDLDCLQIRHMLGDDENRICKLYKKDGSWIYRDVLFDAKVIDGKICKCKRLDVEEFMKSGREVSYNEDIYV